MYLELVNNILDYTASHVIVAEFILDKAIDPSNSESKSTIDI